MRKALLYGWIAVLPCLFTGLAAPTPQSQSQAGDSKDNPQSPKATIPAAPPAAESGKPDPAKLAAPAPASTPKPPAERNYAIGPEDVLRIQVWGDNRLSGEFVVRPDGRISMNLINEIEAAGKTPEELSILIADRLKAGDFMKSPAVNVNVVQVNSRKYYLQGEVGRPGAYPLVVPTTVLEALTNGGGFKDFANQRKIRILRMNKGALKEFKFDYKAVTKGKNLEQNIYLEPGDQIIVP